MADDFRTMVVPAAHVSLARSLCALDEGGAGMFTAGLSATGAEPATHYVSTGCVPPTLASTAPMQVWERSATGSWKKTASEPGSPEAVLAAAQGAEPPVPVTLAKIKALFAAADITTQDPWTAFGRLGLTLCSPAEPAAGAALANPEE